MKRFNAFTMAEVLITFGVIWVVVAMTLPIMIQNHKKHVVENRLEKFYSLINQAILLAENEYGEREYWDWKLPENTLTDYEWFNKYLAKYIKTLKIEENSKNKPIIYFSDGSVVSFGSAGINFYPEAKDFIFYTTKSNTVACQGKKCFTFFYYPTSKKITNNSYYTRIGRTVEPYKYSWDGTIDGQKGLKTSKSFGCSDTSTNPVYCTALIQLNGWKIPKDYPFRF